MKRIRIPRRTFLRGTLAGGIGVSIGLPLLEPMLNGNGTALAQDAALPRRLGVFFFGNGRGVEVAKWRPTGTGASWTPSPLLAPLAGLKDYVSVVTGMNAKLDKSPQGHHRGSAAILSGYEFVTQPANNAPYRSTFQKPSIDQLVAAAVGSATPFKSLELATSSRVIKGEGTTIQYISHNGPDSPNPPEVEPGAVFDRLFAGGGAMTSQPATPAVTDRLRELRSSVLDTVLVDLDAMHKRVGASDRIRLEQHTESIRAIERRLTTMPTAPAVQCDNPARPGAIAGSSGKEPLAERLDAFGDLLTLAMSCDLTRAFTIQWSGSAGGPVFWQVGATRAHHDLSHDGAGAQDVMEKITIFTMEELAKMLVKFRDTPDGAGNLLDSLALMATSDTSDGEAHSVNDYPIVIAGKAGGALKHPGVYYNSNGEHTNKVLLTLLRGVGVQIAEIGEGNNKQTEGATALEA
ncbi:MAG TPA: DUF1552 domain-containing protein [Polyangiales bacterium]|nr:DUF1552 domain-containing protein [Polyangiales bacterium]